MCVCVCSCAVYVSIKTTVREGEEQIIYNMSRCMLLYGSTYSHEHCADVIKKDYVIVCAKFVNACEEIALRGINSLR